MTSGKARASSWRAPRWAIARFPFCGNSSAPIRRRLFWAKLSPETLAAIDSPAAVHELCAMLPTQQGNQPAGPLSSALWEAIAGIRSPHATEELLRTLRTLTPLASPGPHLTTLNWSAGALITALLAIGAQAPLAEFAKVAFADQDDTLRHVATLAAARLDVLAPRLDGLLIQAVRVAAAGTRLVTVRALGQHETPSRRAALVDACLNDQDQEVRTTAATAIRGYQGDEGIHDLITQLAHGEPAIRARAADALALIGDEMAVTPLADALGDEPSLLQISAARALRALEPPDAGRVIDPLVTIATTDPDTEVRALAVKELDQIPEGIDWLFVPFDAAFDEGRYDDALRLLDGMAGSFTDPTRLHWLRAWTLRYLQRLPEALEEVGVVLRNRRDWADALSLRADLLFGLDRGDEGVAAIREAAEQRPDDAKLRAALGWWSYVSGQLDQSIHASQRAVELDPGDVEARLNLGLALLANGDDTLAEQTYQQALERARLGDRAKAVTRLTTAMEELSELERQTSTHKVTTSAVRHMLQAGADNLSGVSLELGDNP